MTIATAPGKLVLFGDYAVLQGAPAAAVSVDVRARAKVDVAAGRDSVFFDLAGGKAYDFVVEPGSPLRWVGEQPADRGTLLAAVMDTCHELAHLRGAVPALRISINTDEFFTTSGDMTMKLGLGSSAAALVALTGALVHALRIPLEETSLVNVCHAAHRRFQGGRGSGIDIAAAVLGQVVGVHPDTRQDYPNAQPIDWPDGLFMLPVWSGNSASTPELVARFEAFQAQSPDAFGHHLRHLTRFARQADVAWRGGLVAELLSALVGYDNALASLDYEAGIGINTDAHEKLRGLAERHGAVYKTSGAGGGDFGIVLTDSAAVRDAVDAELSGAGYTVLRRRLNVDGLTVEGVS